MDINKTDSTATPSDADIRAHLQEAAEAADRGEGPNPLELAPSTQKGAEGKADTDNRASDSGANEDRKPDNPDSSADDKSTAEGDQPRNDKGQFSKKEDGQEEGQQQEQEQKQESNYAKAKKDKERLDRNWKKLEEEKAAVRRQQEELARTAQQLEQSRQTSQAGNNQPRFSSQHLVKAVDQFEANARKALQEGDIEQAQEQLDLANKARVEAHRSYAAEVQEAQARHMAEFGKGWQASTEALIAENPTLADLESKDSKELVQLLQAEPYLGYIADGARKAWEVIKLRRDAAEASGLRDELAKAKKEITRLNSLVSPQGVRGSGSHAGTTSFENLSLEEQRAHLKRQAELADAA